MHRVLTTLALGVAAFALTACSADTPAPTPTHAPTPAPVIAPPPPSPPPAPPTSEAPKTAKKTAPKTSKRPAPTIGAQCRDGDEKRYKVCASHKAWVDDQTRDANSYTGGSPRDPLRKQKQACANAGGSNADCGIGNESRAGMGSPYRDVNGETKAQYCARTGQSLSTCQAG